MRKNLVVVSLVLWMAQSASAQFNFGVAGVEGPASEAVASITIDPEDVVQDSVRRFQTATNKFVVRWQYTEEGAKKMRAFWDANAGKRVRTRVGDFETPPTLIWERRPAQTSNIIPWEKARTDKLVGLSEKDADAVAAGLK